MKFGVVEARLTHERMCVKYYLMKAMMAILSSLRENST